jgi:hypothetical protein
MRSRIAFRRAFDLQEQGEDAGHVDALTRQRYSHSHAKPHDADRNVCAVAGRPRCCALGDRSAWRIPLNELFDAKVIVFGTHFHPDHVPSDSNPAFA